MERKWKVRIHNFNVSSVFWIEPITITFLQKNTTQKNIKINLVLNISHSKFVQCKTISPLYEYATAIL